MKRNQKQQIPDWYCQCQQQHGCSSPIVASCFVCLTKYHCVTNLLFILRPLNLQCMYVCMHLRMQAYAHIYDANSQRKFNRRMNKKLEFQGFFNWLWTNTLLNVCKHLCKHMPIFMVQRKFNERVKYETWISRLL